MNVCVSSIKVLFFINPSKDFQIFSPRFQIKLVGEFDLFYGYGSVLKRVGFEVLIETKKRERKKGKH